VEERQFHVYSLERQSWRRSWVIASRATGYSPITAKAAAAAWPTVVGRALDLGTTWSYAFVVYVRSWRKLTWARGGAIPVLTRTGSRAPILAATQNPPIKGWGRC